MIDAALENRIAYWLVRQGLTTGDEGAVLDGFCGLLLEGGVPLRRVATGADVLHPLLDARGCRWLRGLGIVKEDYSRLDSDFRREQECLPVRSTG